MLPPDVKIVPFYDRQDLIEETTQHGGAQPAARHAAGAGDSGSVSVQRAHRAHRGHHDSVRPDVRVHLPGLAAHPGQPAVHRRDRLRHHRGRRGGDGGEHLPRAGGAARRRGLQPDRRHPRGGARRRAAHLLRDRGDHRRVPAHLRAAPGPPGRLFQPDGGHHVVRAARVAALRADAAAGAVLVLPARHVREPRARFYEWIRSGYTACCCGWCLRHRLVTVAAILADVRRRRCC